MAPNKPRTLISHVMIMLTPAEKARWQVLADKSPFRGNVSALIRDTMNHLSDQAGITAPGVAQPETIVKEM